MKKTLFGFVIVSFFSLYCCNGSKENNAETKVDFSKGSGISKIKLDAQKTEDLALLGKVWGFLKYYHPAVAEGKYNWDYELFKILPKIIASKNVKERNTILYSWIDGLGEVEKGESLKNIFAKVKCRPDLDWISETPKLGDSLSTILIEIKNAKRGEENHYVYLATGIGNPVFTNEDSCAQFKYPDSGYRLLCLFRYWNCIEYFYPNKYLIGENWNNILKEFIPRFLNDSNELQYKLTVSAMIASIHDTHANVMCKDSLWLNYFGKYYSTVKVNFIENKAVVVGFWDDKLGKQSGLKIGDIILKIGDQSTDDFVKEKMSLTHASNIPTALRNLATTLLMSEDSILKITYQRETEINILNLKCFSRDEAMKIGEKYWMRDDTCLKYVANDIGYLYPGTIKNKYFPDIMENNSLGIHHGFLNTRGIIIDLRCYPSEFIVYTFSKYLVPVPTFFAKFTVGNITNPGLFTFTKPLAVGDTNLNYYKGKVVIIVNEKTQSQAEFTSMAFRCAPNATIIGSTTAGADGNVSKIDLIGGISTYISGIGVYYPDGRETQRIGIVPDIEVHPTIKGVMEGRDELLEKAIEIINGK